MAPAARASNLTHRDRLGRGLLRAAFPEDNPCASSTSTRKTLCPAAMTSPETSVTRSTRLIIHERAVGAAQVANFTLRRIDLNHEVIARQGHVLRHRTMDEPRPTHDKRVVPFEDKRAAL